MSTTIAYFVMMICRHFDIKRYVNIKFEKGLLLKSILIYSLSIFLFYQENIYLNIDQLTPKQQELFSKNKEQALLCKRLATLKPFKKHSLWYSL